MGTHQWTMVTILVTLTILCVLTAADSVSRKSQKGEPGTAEFNSTGIPDDRFRKLTAKLDHGDLEKGKKLLQELLDLIYNRYELYSSVGDHFYSNQNMNTHSYDIYKYRMAKKLVGPTEEDRRYLMIFGGSSVTAGHDNRFNSSYPLICGKRLRPAFEALGLDLHVDNIAQGANGCYPYEMCYESMGELDPDFVGWEQSYNCGHSGDSFEYTGRVAGMSKNRGVVYFSASGAWVPQGEASEFTPPYCDEEWTVDSVQAPHTPLKHWYPKEADLQEQRTKLNTFHGGGGSYQRFINDREYVASLAPSGFNVWQENPVSKKCGADMVDPAPRFFTKEAGWYDNPSQHGARHHPTKAFHMFRGEAIAFLHALTTLDAIYMIEGDVAGGADMSTLFKKYDDKLKELQPALPTPKLCEKDGFFCGKRATCYTDFTPHYNKDRFLKQLVIGKSVWKEEGDELTDWHLRSGFQDLKPAFTNENAPGELFLKVPTGETPYILICGAGGESLKHITIQLDLNGGEDASFDYSKYSFESRPGKSEIVTWKDRHYIGAECTLLKEVPKGTHIIGLVRNETLKKNHVSSVAQVVTW